MSKVAKPTIWNLGRSSVLFALAEKEDYALGLAQRTGKTLTPIYRHLKALESEQFIVNIIEGRGQSLYRVNYEKISQVFLDFLMEKREATSAYLRKWHKRSLFAKAPIGNKYRLALKRHDTTAFPFFYLDDDDFKELVVNNRFLRKYFELMFTYLGQQKGQPNTIGDLFEYLVQKDKTAFWRSLLPLQWVLDRISKDGSMNPRIKKELKVFYETLPAVLSELNINRDLSSAASIAASKLLHQFVITNVTQSSLSAHKPVDP